MRNLVTGAGGFLGAHLTAALLGRGETVRALDLDLSHVPAGAEAIEGSVTEARLVAHALEGMDAVFHAAANPQLWARDRAVFERVNVGGTRTVLEAARAAGTRRIVHVSSATTLVGRSSPRAPSRADETVELDEDDMLGPYPRSKRRAELLCAAAAGAGAPVAMVLPTLPVGPGDHHLTAPARMIRDLAAGRTPAVLDCVLNLIDVREVAEGCILAREKGRAGARYLLAGENMTMAAFLDILAGLSGRPMPRRRVPYALALAAAAADEWLAGFIPGRRPKALLTGVRLAGRRVSFDGTKARAELGFAPASPRQALADALAWLQGEGLL